MVVAVIGTGNIGKTVARSLANGGERVVIASRDKSHSDELATQLGRLASSATVREALAGADVIVLALWLDPMKDLISEYKDLFIGKVVIETSNPIKFTEKGEVQRTLPEGTSSGMVISSLLPGGAHYVKAFGTLSADSLALSVNRKPERAVLFYATDDDKAATIVERLIRAAGFEAVRAGGVKDTIRIEVFGDLHQLGGLNGKLLDKSEAEAAVMKEAPRQR